MSYLIREWNDCHIAQRKSDGFINATAMCVANDKDISDWLKTDDTWELVVALADDLDINPKNRISGNSVYTRISAIYPALVIVRRGSPENGGGTWVHSDLAVMLAQWCSPRFAIQVSRWVQELLTTGSVNLIDAPSRPYFYERLQMFQERTGRIPDGYFCIFEETLPLVSQLERYGYNIPDDAVIDSSIGKLFCSYMRTEYQLEPNEYCLKYPHWFPGHSRPVPANLYPIEWLIVFRKWLNGRYYNLHLPKYFKGRKDQPALVAINKFLGLLPGN